MVYKVVETQSAIKDLSEIISHIVVRLQNPQAASELADEISKCYTNLASIPNIYEMCNDARNRAKGYRRLVVKNYIVVYRVDEEEIVVYILRIFYGKRNYIEML